MGFEKAHHSKGNVDLYYLVNGNDVAKVGYQEDLGGVLQRDDVTGVLSLEDNLDGELPGDPVDLSEVPDGVKRVANNLLG